MYEIKRAGRRGASGFVVGAKVRELNVRSATRQCAVNSPRLARCDGRIRRLQRSRLYEIKHVGRRGASDFAGAARVAPLPSRSATRTRAVHLYRDDPMRRTYTAVPAVVII